MAFAVPNVPGVPALFGGFSPVSLLNPLLDISASLPTSLAPQWGIFLGGAPVVVADTVTSMDARQEAVIADYQIEGGSFESYEKVIRPFDVRFRFVAGGNDASRSALFSSIRTLFLDKTSFYLFASPEDIFDQVTISHYDYHRTAVNGVGVPAVDVWGWQLLVGNSSSGTGGTQSIGASPEQNFGAAQLTGTGTANTLLGTSPNLGSLVGSAPLLSAGGSGTAGANAALGANSSLSSAFPQ